MSKEINAKHRPAAVQPAGAIQRDPGGVIAVTFGDWLRHQRQAADLTREELAHQIGCATITVRQYERHQRRPSKAMVGRILDILNIAPAERAVVMQIARIAQPPDDAAPVAAAPPALPPLPLTPLLGRDSIVAAVLALIGRIDRRLITLTGPGGVGKTRLALHLIHETFGGFQDGSVMVPLATVQSADLVVGEIARAVGLSMQAQHVTAASVAEQLRPRHMLLMLDNFEHLLDAADSVITILRCCPDLTIMVTSRHRLGVSGEQVVELRPLDLPPPQAAMDLESLAAVPSIKLFVNRAQSVYPGFRLTAENAAATIEICRRLDGLPLALELAAARVPLFAPRELLARLDQRLAVLSGGSRDMPKRHQSLAAAIAWSFDMIDAPTQRLFAALSIFNGTANLNAIQAICAASGETETILCDSLGELVDSHLIQTGDEAAGDRRFHMLETVREFAAARLALADAEALRRRYWDYYSQLATTAADFLIGPEQQRWLETLNAEYSHLQATLQGLLDAAAIEQALQVGIKLGRYWYIRGLFSEGRHWLTALLTQANGCFPLEEARVRGTLAAMITVQNDYDAAIALNEQNLAYFRATGNETDLGKTLANMAVIYTHAGRYDEAIATISDALVYTQRGQNPWEIANIQANLGVVLANRGDFIEAEAAYMSALEGFRQCGDQIRAAITLNNYGRNLSKTAPAQARAMLSESQELSRAFGDSFNAAIAGSNLAELALEAGQIEEACALLLESLRVFVDLKVRMPLSYSLERAAHVLTLDGDYAFAVQLLSLAHSLRRDQYILSPSDQAYHDERMATLRAKTDAATWRIWWNAGRIAPEQALVQAVIERLAARAAPDHAA